MTPDQQQLDRLFQKFIEGSCTPQEEQLLWKWVLLLDARSQEIMRRSQEQETAIGEEMHSTIMAHVKPVRKTFLLFRPYIAAAAILLAVLTTALLFLLPHGPKNQVVLAGQVNTDNGHIRSFYLPDSTKVTLNLASSLSWTTSFNEQERRVVLQGEGYFEVHPDSRHPFIVESQGMETKALGTAFNIEAYGEESEMRVSLLHGKVAITDVRNTLSPAILMPGQLLRYHYQQNTMQVENITVSNTLAWVNGGMTFNRIPLTEALDRLARRYHITIHYNQKQLKTKTVSGSFNNTSWEKLLPNVLFVHDLKYNIKDSTINIRE